MPEQNIITFFRDQLAGLEAQGLYKKERVLQSPQGAHIRTGERSVINLCANNYLGLANDPRLKAAATSSLERYGYGLASVRFICGTQTVHKDLEAGLAAFLGKEDAILYSSCFDANTGLFETLLSEQDAIISDELNHASIIDGIRLCKAKRLRYRNNNIEDLNDKLEESKGSRFRMIATDGVFSMDGSLARLPEIVRLAKQHDALLMVDDSHAVGFMGGNGRGTHEHFGVMDQVDIITGTLGKALGGASGGYVAGPKVLIDWLRQRSRPYLFSNTLAPMIAAASLTALDLLQSEAPLRERLFANARKFRQAMSQLGFSLLPGEHPIIPIMIGDAQKARSLADELLAFGVYVTSFSYPVVPQGLARIRTQMSAAHSEEALDQAITAFANVGKRLGII